MSSPNRLKRVLTLAAVMAAAGAVLSPGLPSADDAAARSSATAPTARTSLNDNAVSGVHRVPLFPSASDPFREGFVRVINRSEQGGEVAIAAIDDAGRHSPEITLAIGANETAHFNSDDLEQSATGKGLSGGTGSGQGDWRLELTAEFDIEVLAYIRTGDGFLTAMHHVGPPDPDAPAGTNAERHFERIVEFYLERSDLGEPVPLSFGEELALARLFSNCGLFREDVLGPGVFWLA